MEIWIQLIIALATFAGGIIFFTWVLGTALDEYFESKRIEQFEKDFEESVKHSQPTWEEIKDIASTRRLTQIKVQHVFKNAKREILTGRNKDLEPHKEIIQNYLEQFQKDEPFEGLPNEIRLHLERMREKIDGSEELLEPLTTQIKELLLINDREKKVQKYYTVAGFFIGLLGFTFALFVYFKDPEITKTNTPPVNNLEVVIEQ